MQLPNAPLWVGLGGGVVAAVIDDGVVHDGARIVGTAGLAVWAVLELAQGVNWFRRARLVSAAGSLGCNAIVSRPRRRSQPP